MVTLLYFRISPSLSSLDQQQRSPIRQVQPQYQQVGQQHFHITAAQYGNSRESHDYSQIYVINDFMPLYAELMKLMYRSALQWKHN